MANIRKYAITVLLFLYFLNVALFLGFYYRTWTVNVFSKCDVTTSMCGAPSNSTNNTNPNVNTSTPFNDSLVEDVQINLRSTNKPLPPKTVQVEDKHIYSHGELVENITNTKIHAISTTVKTEITKINLRQSVPQKSVGSREPNYNSLVNIDLDAFTFIMNPMNICNDENIFLVTLVTSKHDHLARRQTIRSTWGSVKQVDDKKIATLFLFGKSNNSDMWPVLREYRKYQDIVLADFDDTYLNLTIKTLMGLKWFKSYCPNVPYVLKTDDDVFVNYLTLVRELADKPRIGFALGHLTPNASVYRNTSHKWYTPKEVYPLSVYPSYLQGTGYILSRDVATEICTIASQTRYLNWEDVYIGICLKKLGVTLSHDVRFDHWNDLNRKKTQDRPCPVHYIFTIHSLNVELLKRRWKRYLGEKHLSSCKREFPNITG